MKRTTHLCNIEDHRHGKVEVRIGTAGVDPEVPRDRCHEKSDQGHTHNDQTVSDIYRTRRER